MEIITINQEEQERLVADILDIPKQRLDVYGAEIGSYDALSETAEKEMRFALYEALHRARQFVMDLEDYLANNED